MGGIVEALTPRTSEWVFAKVMNLNEAIREGSDPI